MLIKLKNSKIFRGGITARELNQEHTTAIATVNKYQSFSPPFQHSLLDIGVALESKGGGRTCMRIEIDWQDLESMLKQIASEIPESEKMFADCLSIAGEKANSLISKERQNAIKKEKGESQLKELLRYMRQSVEYESSHGKMNDSGHFVTWLINKHLHNQEQLISSLRYKE